MPIELTLTDLKKSIHVKLLTTTHTSLRIQSFRLKLSIQEMIEELAQRVIMEDPAVMTILHDLTKRKRDKEYKRVTSIDADAIYDMIEKG